MIFSIRDWPQEAHTTVGELIEAVSQGFQIQFKYRIERTRSRVVRRKITPGENYWKYAPGAHFKVLGGLGLIESPIGLVSDHYVEILDDDISRYICINIANIDATTFFEWLISDEVSALGALSGGYGYAFNHTNSEKAIIFDLGVSLFTEKDVAVILSKSSRTWGQEVLSCERRYLHNFIRDIYPYNILTKAHVDNLLSLAANEINLLFSNKSLITINENMYILRDTPAARRIFLNTEQLAGFLFERRSSNVV